MIQKNHTNVNCAPYCDRWPILTSILLYTGGGYQILKLKDMNEMGILVYPVVGILPLRHLKHVQANLCRAEKY
jgi:hypothetical protein